ncbi:MAG: flagellar motor switch protein FliG [Hyphomicrobiales bacterium]|uniref:flagellar motor switch protein FliG n=1 Tax=Rhabdaerophilum calidifontis TaxID=2604328 RepID=UPI00123A659F|nr:flagellar motor switch protein FliG [Rhabdaerophilum calidifontis]MCA1952878.1 flagellar motor switch protein FliG [Hyphomicrobiales bacterium]MCA1999118.1 flagellar motor switch protein FliG [Hyphomicrobiales bacterium]
MAKAATAQDTSAEQKASSPNRELTRYLTGPEKAAIILLVLGERYGGEIWASLDEDEIRTVSRAMSRLGAVTAEAVEALVAEFLSMMAQGGAVTGDFDRTEALLSKLLPKEKVYSLMEELRGPAGRNMWQKLGNVQDQVLANYLKGEYPQTVAVILSKIRSEHAARVLSLLPHEFALEVVNRMLNMEPVQKEVLNHIEETLRTEFISNLSQTSRRDSHEMIAEIFNSFDRQTESWFLAALDERNREAAQKIRSLMFTFEDLQKLDPGSTQTLIRYSDRDLLAVALKGAPPAIKKFFFSQMSTRAARNMEELMQSRGPVRLKEVDDAQTKIVMLAKELASRGEITIGKNRAEDELIY